MMIRFEEHSLIALLCTQNEILSIFNLNGSSQRYMGFFGPVDVRDNQFIYIFVQNIRNEITLELISLVFFMHTCHVLIYFRNVSFSPR